jgi:aspartyl-tRNA(Asn)/glutamyl-tRNA(Gln) amidotransferase subunit B
VFGGLELSQFLHQRLPELPEEARQRLMEVYGLSEYLATVLTGDPPAIQMLDKAIQVAWDQLVATDNNKNKNTKLKDVAAAVANFLCNELFALVRENQLKVKNTSGDDNDVGEEGDASLSSNSTQYSRVTGTQLGELVSLVLNGVISNNMAKQILPILFHDEADYGKSPAQVAHERGYRLVVNRDELTLLCTAVIDEHPDEMERYQKGGKYAQKITKFLLGKAMAKSGGNAQPERLNEILENLLDQMAPGVNRK